MRVRGLGYWIGAGLGAIGLIGILLWFSMASARPSSRIVVPDRASAVTESVAEPGSDRSKTDEQRAIAKPAGPDTALNHMRSRPVNDSDTARERAAEGAKEQADDPSAVTKTTGEKQPQSRILRVDTDGKESGVDRSGDKPADEADDADEGPSASTAPAEPATTTTTAQPERRSTTTTTATSTTTAKPTTQSAGRETTTTKAPAISTTASTTTRPPTTAKPTTTKSPTTAASSGGGGSRPMEQRVIELTNDARRQAGCPALVHNDKLRQAAYLHSKDMSDNDYFSHSGLDGSSPGDRMSRQGYRFRSWAENIAWGYRSPEAVVEGWMNSAGHRANILNCGLTEIGVGLHDYYWTQKFGTPR